MKYNDEVEGKAKTLQALLKEKDVLSEDEFIDTEEDLNEFISTILSIGIITVKDKKFLSSLANSLEGLVERVLSQQFK